MAIIRVGMYEWDCRFCYRSFGFIAATNVCLI
jgi:hypothetical protein